MRRGYAVWLGALLWLLGVNLSQAAVCPPSYTDAYKGFLKAHVQDDGRVVDWSTPEQITTSEGQSYGLFFALVANDRPSFDRLLAWTENNLSLGGVDVSLPAWKWGMKGPRTWGVLDPNSASDSDLWIAYTLLEAARLWNVEAYRKKALALLSLVEKEESANIAGFGSVVLPGRIGFVLPDGSVRANPSYLPTFMLRRFAEVTRNPFWQNQWLFAQKLLLKSAVKGYVPDWVTLKDGQVLPDVEKGPFGSYDAIRVYLWLGLSARDEPGRQQLVGLVMPYLTLSERLGSPVEKVHTLEGQFHGVAPPGFTAALGPLANELKLGKLSARYKDLDFKVGAGGPALTYYDQVLTLFAKGYTSGRYKLDKSGQLTISREQPCTTTRKP